MQKAELFAFTDEIKSFQKEASNLKIQVNQGANKTKEKSGVIGANTSSSDTLISSRRSSTVDGRRFYEHLRGHIFL